MIEIHATDESNAKRLRRSGNKHAWFDIDDSEDYEDDELAFFGIVVRKKYVSSCPYNEKGEYVPRNRR